METVADKLALRRNIKYDLCSVKSYVAFAKWSTQNKRAWDNNMGFLKRELGRFLKILQMHQQITDCGTIERIFKLRNIVQKRREMMEIFWSVSFFHECIFLIFRIVNRQNFQIWAP